MSAPQIANDNRDVIALLPAPLACELFDIGYKVAEAFILACNIALPRPSFDDLLIWLSDARKDARDQATRSLWKAFEREDDDVEWMEWAADRIAQEGFETACMEARR